MKHNKTFESISNETMELIGQNLQIIKMLFRENERFDLFEPDVIAVITLTPLLCDFFTKQKKNDQSNKIKFILTHLELFLVGSLQFSRILHYQANIYFSDYPHHKTAIFICLTLC